MLSLVTVSPVITAFHRCCLSHHIFWPAWVGIETAIFWQCSPWIIWPKNPTLNTLWACDAADKRRWISTVPGEHCQKIAVSIPIQAGQRFTWSKTWCDRQQLWKAVITGDTVTRLRSRLITWRRPEVKFGRNVVKKKQHKNYQDEDKESVINKKN